MQDGLRLGNTEGGGNRTHDAGCATKYHHHKAVHNVQGTCGRAGRSNRGKGRTSDTGNAAAQGKRHTVDFGGVNAHRTSHGTVLYGGAYTQAPARLEHKHINTEGHQRGQHHDEHTVNRDIDIRSRIERTQHPFWQFGTHFFGAKAGAEDLLHDQAQTPGRQQSIQRPLVEMPDHNEFNKVTNRKCQHEGNCNGEHEVIIRETIISSHFGNKHGGVCAYGHKLTMRHVNHPHLPERSAMPIYGNTIKFSKKGNAIVAMPKLFQDSLLMLADTRQNNFKIVKDENANNYTVKASNTKFNGVEIPFITSFDLGIKLLQDSLHNDITAIDAEVKTIGWKNLYSQPTDSLLKTMMHRSDNFFAEQTLLMISNERLGYMNDRKIIDTILKTDYAAMPQKPRWVDGSGLSRYDLVTPQDFVFVLNKMKQEFSWNRITSILQTGNQGTLTGLYKNYAGKIYAKTGTLSGVVALSGYIITNKGKQYIFSLLVNSHQTSASNIRKGFEKFITEIINKY